MKDSLGWSQCQTLPNKFRNSTFFPKKESYLSPKTSVYTLPPRPSVSRSFSFSESYSPETCQKNKSKNQPDSNLTRTHSLYGLQDSRSKEGTINPRCSVSPQKEIKQPLQPLSRSLSLASLQPASVQNNLGQSQTAATSASHAGIWARGRKTSSCRNLKDLNNDPDSLQVGLTTPAAWLTKVDPPVVPMRSKKTRKPPSSRSSLTRLSEDSCISSDSGRWSDTPPMQACNNRLRSSRISLTGIPSHASPGSTSPPWFTNHTENRSDKCLPSLHLKETPVLRHKPSSSLSCWLDSLEFSCYHSLFLMAGYDLPTISRMTPEDLTAIGIQHPGHRKKLKAAISCLNIPDGLPDFLPGSLAEWLRMIRLEEYGPGLVQQGYTTIQDICTVSIEDLEDIGFYRLGHQKRLLLAIKKIKEITKYQPEKHTRNYNKPKDHLMSTNPNLILGNTRPTFYAAKPHSISPVKPYKLPNSCLEASPRHQHNQILHSGKQNISTEPCDEGLPSMPEPMKPFPHPLYLLDILPTYYNHYQQPQATIIPSTSGAKTPSQKNMNTGEEIKQISNKVRPIAKVVATARNCQNQVENKKEETKNEKENKVKQPRGRPATRTDESHMVRSSSLTCFHESKPVTNSLCASSPAIMRRKAVFDSSPDLTATSKESPIEPTEYKTPLPRKNRTRSAGDVLQDIGSMLSDLTLELDAMLNMEDM